MEFETKEELFGMLHEMLEWIGPAREKIENANSSEFTIGQNMALSDVVNALYDLDVALSELEQVANV